jgi:hypothetical protein
MAEKQDEEGRGGLRRRLGAITVDEVMAARQRITDIEARLRAKTENQV